MAKIDFGGVLEDVVTRDEFPLSKAREVLKNEIVAVIGYGVQGPAQAMNMKDNGINVIVGQAPEFKADWDKDIRTYWSNELKQNITTLHNRINELGVAEPVIQQQGLDRIVVQLPGVQDTAKAKDILGRTATLELRMVDESAEGRAAAIGTGPVPFGAERYLERGGQAVIVKKQVILTGENLTDAQPGFDNQTHEAVVNLSLDAKGARIFRDVTRDNIGKRMAILLFEKGKGEVVTAPVIRTEIGGKDYGAVPCTVEVIAQ